jgi:hypothetical protein
MGNQWLRELSELTTDLRMTYLEPGIGDNDCHSSIENNRLGAPAECCNLKSIFHPRIHSASDRRTETLDFTQVDLTPCLIPGLRPNCGGAPLIQDSETRPDLGSKWTETQT